MLPPDRTSPNDRDATAARRAASWQTDPDASIERLDPSAVFEVRSVAHLLDDDRAGIRSEMAPSSKVMPSASAPTDDVSVAARYPSSSVALRAAPTPVPPAMPSPRHAAMLPPSHAPHYATPLPAAPRSAIRPEAIVRRQTLPQTPRSAFARVTQPIPAAPPAHHMHVPQTHSHAPQNVQMNAHAASFPKPLPQRPTKGRADETVLVNAVRVGRSPWLVVLVLAPVLALLGAATAWFLAAPSSPPDTTRIPNVVESSRTPIAPSAVLGRQARAVTRTTRSR